MHTMGMPTPHEAWDSATEALEKLHEIELAMGGIGIAEAAEHMAQMGVVLEGAGEAGALTVSWWVGNAIGCIVTAAVGDKIVDAIEYIVEPINWSWIEAKMNQVSYPIPSFAGVYGSPEETTTRSSSTAHDDPPPHPVIDCGTHEAEWVRYLQQLLVERYGYHIDVDGDYGTKTATAVRDFKHHHNLGGSTEIDYHTWQALEGVGVR
jgi:hypothetical protein